MKTKSVNFIRFLIEEFLIKEIKRILVSDESSSELRSTIAILKKCSRDFCRNFLRFNNPRKFDAINAHHFTLLTILSILRSIFPSFINFKSLFKQSLPIFNERNTYLLQKRMISLSFTTFNPSSQILIIQLPPVNERITQIDERKPKIFFHLLEKWMIFLLIHNFQSQISCWKLFNLRQSNYRKRHFSVEKFLALITVWKMNDPPSRSQILSIPPNFNYSKTWAIRRIVQSQEWIILGPLVRTIFDPSSKSKSLAGNYSTCSPFNGDEKN